MHSPLLTRLVDPFPACSENERGLPKNKYRESIEVFCKSATIFSYQCYINSVSVDFIRLNLIKSPFELNYLLSDIAFNLALKLPYY